MMVNMVSKKLNQHDPTKRIEALEKNPAFMK
jgi:hypothetical protein